MFNQRLLNAFDMSPRRMDECLDEWDRFRPHCLFGYPSSISLLVEHARARGRPLDTTCLAAVFVTGEVCHPYQRKDIADFFGVPVADGYGSREGGFIAHDCPLGNMHITAENVVVEVIDAGGCPLPPGQTGEIVITHLDNYAMPFIRYRTGDIGRLRAGRCACGRGLPLMDLIQGRSTDFLYLPDGTIKHALSIIYPLRETPGVRRFHVTQREDFSVLVEIVRDETGASISSGLIADRVRPVVGDAVVLDVRFVEQLRVAASGKHRQVVSHARRPLSVSPSPFRAEGWGEGLGMDSVRFSGLPRNAPAHPEPEPSAEIATRV
jgi:phenylacetate-CoA ligase